MQIHKKDISIRFEENEYTIQKGNKCWRMPSKHNEIVLKNDRCVAFSSAANITVSQYKSGVGEGIKVRYREFRGVNFAFDTIVWIEESSGNILFEWIPVNEHGYEIKEIVWPSAIESKTKGYSLIPYRQGILLPHDDKHDYENILPFDGQLCSCAAYMPWLAQVEEKDAYLMINETPWDARYVVKHTAKQNQSEVSMRMLPSLGKMSYRRVIRYVLFDDASITTICKTYRKYAKEQGKLTTLKQKQASGLQVDQLVGASFVHTTIKKKINKDSKFYDFETIQNNESITTFEEKVALLSSLKEKGAEKLYVHLDGWGQPGYDNQHPDYLPVCEEAGGYEGLRNLIDYVHKEKMSIGLHDQYRDYYHNATSYDKQFALQASDGSYAEHRVWAGGAQNYLCATQAKYYVKRNFETLFAHGIKVDASYLDVFTCNELDECINPMHRMSRKQCMQEREACFQYVSANGMLVSSEEANEWAMNSLVFAHYGPYEFMLRNPQEEKIGIGVPLFNLVYHDCVILPWPMHQHKEDMMLYALLNGGAPYLLCEKAYPQVDGAFDYPQLPLAQQIERCKIVSDWHREVAYEEMLSFAFIDQDYQKQKVVFANEKEVSIDLTSGEYTIK